MLIQRNQFVLPVINLFLRSVAARRLCIAMVIAGLVVGNLFKVIAADPPSMPLESTLDAPPVRTSAAVAAALQGVAISRNRSSRSRSCWSMASKIMDRVNMITQLGSESGRRCCNRLIKFRCQRLAIFQAMNNWQRPTSSSSFKKVVSRCSES